MLIGILPMNALAAENASDGNYKRLEALMERGSVSTAYDLGYTSSHYSNYVRSAFDIKTGGASSLSVEKLPVAHGEIYVQFFASDYNKISSVKYSPPTVVSIPAGCDFIRVEIQTTAELEKIAIRFYDGAEEPREAMRSGINEVSEKLTYKVSDDVHTTSRLMLPPNYSIDGEKVPLILWLEGSGSSLSTWGGNFNSNKLDYLRYLRDEGFAVFSVYAWGNEYAEKYPKCGNSFPYPIPTNLACIREGIEYICSRYNIDADNIHIMSKSQGGQCALYYASCNELNVKSIGMFAPVLDYLSMPGEAMYKDTRAAIADDLDFTGDVAYFASDRFLSYSDEGRAFLRQNLDKLLTMNEAWTNLTGATAEELFESSMDDCETFWTEKIWTTDRTDIYTHTDYVKTASVPVKIWGARDDAATPYPKMVEVVEQLKNGGSVAEMRTLPNGTGGHSCADVGTTRVDVTTALGIEHKNVPIGWVENVEWIRTYSPHTHDYVPSVTLPTCTEKGCTTYTCNCGDSYVADYVDATGKHNYENGFCTGCNTASSPYLQQLPESFSGCSNLYDMLNPAKGYYTATKYDTSNGAVLSVVISVEPGDRIAASSFGPVSENKGSVNGIRVTYLLGDQIVTSLSAGDVYNGYTKNGYITVPDGVDAVCIPWWKPMDSNWLTLARVSNDYTTHSPKPAPAQEPTCTEGGYTAGDICEYCGISLGTRVEIPATGHNYDADTCTICGNVNVLAVLDGKYVSVLGDSISSFNGYSNDAAVNTTIGGNAPRYDAGTADTKPGSYCLLESVDDTWWMEVANRSGMKLLVNNSWAGSQVFGSQTSDGRQIPPAYLDRCINLHDDTVANNPNNAPVDPDVIFVYLGINDYNFNRSNVGSGAVDYANLVNSDGSYVTPTTFSEAYGILLHKMRSAYPHAQIFAMTLLPENLYSVDLTAWEQHNAYIRAAAEYYDIPLVDLAKNCAITWDNYSGYMIDKIHPTTAGMELIADCVEAELQAYYLAHEHRYTTVVTLPTCTEQGYTTYTCECGDTYRTEWLAEDAYNGKTIACIGDSITYGYGVTQGNTDYVTLLAEQLGMSYIRLGDSGTTLCTDGNRTCNIRRLTEDQIQGADIVTIALGINDFCAAGAGYYELGDINSTDTSTIYGAARMWCERIEELRKTDSLSHTQFYFMTPVITSWNNSVTSGRNWDQSKTNIHGYTLRDLCNAIMEVAALYDVAVIDMNLLSGMYYVDDQDNNVSVFGGDGVHPGEKGHEMMASALANALLQNHLRDDHTHTFGSWITTTWPSCTGGEQHRVCTICSAVESRTTDPNGNHRYNAVVTAPTYNQQGYTTYTCSVCGDSYISDYTEATQPHSYRWEMQNNALVSISDNGNTVNALTLTNGSITNGTLHGARYNLQNKVHLRHDLPWAIEWRSAGNWDGMLLASATQSSSAGLTYLFRFAGMDFLALGEYNGTWNNYGLIHKIDMTASHVFRLENRIAADGTNAVYLLVDGQEIDTMDHYYVGGTNKNQTVNWANGRDLVFSNIGTASHPMKDMKLDYLQIWENGHVHSYDSVVTLPTCTEQGYTTYTCDCGDSYVDNYTEATGHSYASGVCPSCGDTKPAPVITKQPETANSALGEKFTICVEAEGDGLTYQWYYKDKGMTDFAESVVKKAVYSFKMVSFRVGRQYYCEITDQYGNTVRTETVKSTTDLKILDQPQSVEVEIGEKAVITIAAIGEGLQYQWYYKNKNDEDFSVSSYKGKTYSMTMAEFCHNRQVYCVVTDAYGNCVTSEIATMSRPPVELKILNQPADVYAAKDEKFSIKADVQGDGLTYQWYYKEGSGKVFAPSSNRTSAYAYTTQSYMNNRQVYCVITDQYGNQVTTETVTIHVIK